MIVCVFRWYGVHPMVVCVYASSGDLGCPVVPLCMCVRAHAHMYIQVMWGDPWFLCMFRCYRMLHGCSYGHA